MPPRSWGWRAAARRTSTLWGAANGIEFTADQTSAQFTHSGLARYDVVVFLSTVGGVRGTPRC